MSTAGSPPVSKKLRDFERYLHANGFRVASTEGVVFIEQERSFLATHFYRYVSPSLREYLELMKPEFDRPFADDAELALTPAEYVTRMIRWERFEQAHPGFPKQLITEYGTYLWYAFSGMDNSPVLLDDGLTLSPYFRELYELLRNRYPQSRSQRAIAPYYAALQRQDTATAGALRRKYQAESGMGE